MGTTYPLIWGPRAWDMGLLLQSREVGMAYIPTHWCRVADRGRMLCFLRTFSFSLTTLDPQNHNHHFVHSSKSLLIAGTPNSSHSLSLPCWHSALGYWPLDQQAIHPEQPPLLLLPGQKPEAKSRQKPLRSP